MKIAILFSGLHYKENYKQGLTKNNTYNINYKDSFNNIKTNILDNNNIDVYISSETSRYTNDLLNDYKPVDYIMKNINFDDLNMKNYSYSVKTYPIKNLRILYGLELIKKSKIEYDYIIITRFDIQFNLKLNEMNIDYNKDWNIGFKVENNVHIEDNFWIIKNSIVDKFIDLFKKRKNKKLKTHCINQFINEDNGVTINYIYNKPYNILLSPFYTLNRS